ncbi:hypothetical protein ACR6HW_07330 [Fusibacter sp. JL298sf-3]
MRFEPIGKSCFSGLNCCCAVAFEFIVVIARPLKADAGAENFGKKITKLPIGGFFIWTTRGELKAFLRVFNARRPFDALKTHQMLLTTAVASYYFHKIKRSEDF